MRPETNEVRLARVEERQTYFMERHDTLLKAVESLSKTSEKMLISQERILTRLNATSSTAESNAENIAQILPVIKYLGNGYTSKNPNKERAIQIGIPTGMVTLAVVIIEAVQRFFPT